MHSNKSKIIEKCTTGILKKLLVLVFGCYITFLSTNQAVAQSDFPLDVQVTIAPPYPIRLSDYTDFDAQVFVDVTNNTDESYEIILSGYIANEERGVRIETDPNNLPTRCITIFPGMNRLTGEDLKDLFDPDHLKATGTTIDQIQNDEALPEGNYTICIRAFDCRVGGKALSPQPDLFSGCFTYDVAYVDPPVIIMPECGENISADRTSITFNWLFVPPATGYGETRFRIRMVEIDPPGRNPFDVMNSATSPYLFDQDDIISNNFNLFTDADVLLEQGKSYAYEVIAYDPSEEIQFRNNGASEVCWFTYGNSLSSDLTFEPAYPKSGDYLPFNFFPFIIKFDPLSDQFSRFEGEVTLRQETSGSGRVIDRHSSDSNWGRIGPLEWQRRNVFSGISDEQASHLPVYKTNDESDITFERGETYGWQFDGRMELTSGETLENDFATQDFKIGMAPVTQRAPANGSTVAPGNIKLEWQPEQPENLFPPFDIVRSEGGRSRDFFTGTIDEHWILEVSPSETFDSIYFSDHQRIRDLDILTSAEEDIISQLYPVTTRDTAFTTEGIYYWRVRWLKSPGDLSSASYSTSPTWQFKIGNPSDSTTTTPEPTPEDCISECLSAEISDETPVSITNGQTLRLGKFNLKINSLTSSGTNQYNGEGEITVGFLNNVKIRVNFTGIKANAGGQIFSGKANAAEDLPAINMDSISTAIDGVPISIPDLDDTQSDAVEEIFESGDRLVSLLSGRSMGMPLGLDTEIDDYRFVIAITEMEFKPRKATMTAVSRIDIPALGDKLPAFGARGVCITPSGLGDEYALYLARDHEIFSSGDSKFVFNGAMDGDTTKASYIEFDCTGFKCARLSGTVTLPKDKLLAENEDGTINEEGNVTGTFAFKGCRGNNYIGSIEFSAFQVKGMKGWGFKPIVAYLDWSDLENPPGFTFPENYEFSSDSRLVNTWKGFYLKELSLHAPPEFEHDIVGDIEANVQNVIIDETGFTGSVAIMNLIDYDDGEVEGWAFSMDSLAFGIVQNTSFSGGFRGKLGTPIFDDEDYLKYSTLLSYHDDTLAYNFQVFVDDTLNVDIWKADMYLAPDSRVVFEAGSDIETSLTADLHGGVSIEGDLGVPQLSLPGVEFQGLHLSTKDQFRIAHWAFTSPQKSAAGFPLNINDIGLSGGFTNPSLEFDVGLTLSNAGFSAEVGFQLIGKIETDADDRIKFKYDRTDLDAISIDQTMDGGIRIAGELIFYREDPVYGKGMKGDVAVTLPMGIGVEVGVQFGTIRTNPTALFNTREYFSYWYVDGMVRIPPGTVTLFPGFEARGFGGGAYHRMRPESPPPDPEAALTAAGSGGSSGVRYVPHWETLLGFKAGIVLATAKEETFNMDVGLEARFNTSGGLSYIGIDGDGYLMAAIDEREEAKVTASVGISYSNDSEGGKRVEGYFDVYVKFGEIIRGIGENDRFVNAKMFADDEKWYFHMGKPMPVTERGGLTIDLKVLQAELTSYLMVGHDIPTTLPPLPEKIRRLVYGPQQASIDGTTDAADVDSRELPGYAANNLRLGKGFAFGAHLDFETRLDFAIFYAKLGLAFGFDLNVTQDSSRVCYETGLTPGINDWYATGQMYAALEGELGVQVNLWFVKGEFPIINLAAAFAMRGGLPNPAWMEGRAGLSYRILGGMIKGHCNFKVNVGEKCSYTDPNPFADIEFIAGFEPDNGQTDISVFTSPQVAFSLPVHQILELPAGLEDEPEKVRVFYPFVDDITLYDIRNRKNVPGSHSIGSENVTALFESTGALEAYAQHRFTVTVKSREYFPNGTNDLVRINGRVWQETKSSSWTTGERPDVILEDQVAYTYPFDRQAYFLQNETRNGQGLLKYVGPNQNYLLETEDEEGNKYEIFARFIKLEDGSNQSGAITKRADRFYFQVPRLEKSTIYGVQIVRKKLPPPTSVQDQLQQSFIESNRNSDVARTIREAMTRDLLGAGNIEIDLMKTELLPTERAQANEKLLYTFNFRTSQFNSFSEKMNSLNLRTSYNYFGGSLFENVQIQGSIEEPFDRFEINGVYKNGSKMIGPLISLIDLQSNRNWTATARYYIYDLHRSVKRMNGRAIAGMPYRRYSARLADLPSTRNGKGIFNVMPFYTIELSSDTYVGPILRDWELDRAAGIGAYGTSSTTGTATASNSSASGNFGIAMETLSTSINMGSGSAFSGFSLQNSGTSEYDFGVNVFTNLYVKLDAQALQRQLARWMATEVRSLQMRRSTYAQKLYEDDRTLYRKINRFISLPISYFSFRNGSYQYRFLYKHPGSTIAPGVNKSFTINYHDESLR